MTSRIEIFRINLFLRWDHADTSNYYLLTGERLQNLLNQVIVFENSMKNTPGSNSYNNINVNMFIDYIYDNIITALIGSSNATVPVRSKQFYKFWWNEELDCLKHDSITAHNVWKAAGRPRSGPLFNKARTSKLLYKRRIRECQRCETASYTNDLHEALIQKDGTAFWKCWRSKFEPNRSRPGQIDNLTDETDIVNKFEDYFTQTCCNLTTDGSQRLKDEYEAKRAIYCGLPFDDELLIDVDLVDRAVKSLVHGKAAGLDGLTAEHLQHSHPALISILNKLFNLLIKFNYVPKGFGISYTVPLPKNSYSVASKSLSVEDFRGISISAVISKVFEKCILDRYQRFFETSDSQFGFKKGLSCSHAIFSVKCVVDEFVNNGSTINLCCLDLRKAFDKMNHHGLFIKPMERMLPVNLLATLEYWFSLCFTSVRWGDCYSNFI